MRSNKAWQSSAAAPVRCRNQDIRDCPVEKASVVILNFTLQFIAPGDRDRLLRAIYRGMTDGGVLILSEKILGR